MRKGKNNISQTIYRSIVLLGLTVGFLALTFSSPLASQSTVSASQEETADKPSDHQEPELSLKSFDAITSSVQISFDHDFYLIDILPSLTDQEENLVSDDQIVMPAGKALKILFRRIISPNAP